MGRALSFKLSEKYLPHYIYNTLVSRRRGIYMLSPPWHSLFTCRATLAAWKKAPGNCVCAAPQVKSCHLGRPLDWGRHYCSTSAVGPATTTVAANLLFLRARWRKRDGKREKTRVEEREKERARATRRKLAARIKNNINGSRPEPDQF